VASPDPGTPTPTHRRVGLLRTVVVNLSVLVGVTLLLNALLVWNLGAPQRARQREQLAQQVAALIAEQVEARLMRGDGTLSPDQAAVIEPLVFSVSGGELAPQTVLVVDASLQTVARVGEVPGDDGLPPADLRQAVLERRSMLTTEYPAGSFLGPRYVSASTPILLDRQLAGGVRVTYPLGGTLTWVADTRLLVFFLYAIGAVVIIAAFGSGVFRKGVLQPINVLMVGTRRVAEGTFSIRVPEEEPNELGELASSFNLMAEELQRYQARTEEQVGELQHINDLLERTQHELAFQARMAGVGRLAAGVAHEIGNPLAAVMGMVDLLREGENDGEERDDLLRRIGDELQRVHATLRTLLDYARPPEGLVEELALGEVVRSAVEMVAVQKDFAGVTIQIQVPDDHRVLAEPGRLRQVLVNLLLNARDAVDGRGTVVLVAEGGDDRCLLRVRDDGPGIPPGEEDSIFDPFYTTKDPGQGTGLGLSVSLQLVESFGGRLRYRQGSDGGAEFVVELPTA